MQDNIDLILQENDKLLFSFDGEWEAKFMRVKYFLQGKCNITRMKIIIEYFKHKLDSPRRTEIGLPSSGNIFKVPMFYILPRNLIKDVERKKDTIIIKWKRNSKTETLKLRVVEKNKNKRASLLQEIYDILSEDS